MDVNFYSLGLARWITDLCNQPLNSNATLLYSSVNFHGDGTILYFIPQQNIEKKYHGIKCSVRQIYYRIHILLYFFGFVFLKIR